jgi:hypothetical protein
MKKYKKKPLTVPGALSTLRRMQPTHIVLSENIIYSHNRLTMRLRIYIEALNFNLQMVKVIETFLVTSSVAEILMRHCVMHQLH